MTAAELQDEIDRRVERFAVTLGTAVADRQIVPAVANDVKTQVVAMLRLYGQVVEQLIGQHKAMLADSLMLAAGPTNQTPSAN